ncbi:MAG: hypothetical protein HKP16_10575 [Xanthomonadales bacterium]|nr:hypothetical protein [Xanthomonadales bacterium]
MKAIIFLVAVALVLAAVIYRMRKAQAEEVRARHKEIQKRKEKSREAIMADQEVIWPVIVKTVKGDGSDVDEEASHDKELAMTSIEFEQEQRMSS